MKGAVVFVTDTLLSEARAVLLAVLSLQPLLDYFLFLLEPFPVLEHRGQTVSFPVLNVILRPYRPEKQHFVLLVNVCLLGYLQVEDAPRVWVGKARKQHWG